MRSHPVWVCGLKQENQMKFDYWHKSHPVWVCGLKQARSKTGYRADVSHPVWVCGLKLIKVFNHRRQSSHTLYGCVD